MGGLRICICFTMNAYKNKSWIFQIWENNYQIFELHNTNLQWLYTSSLSSTREQENVQVTGLLTQHHSHWCHCTQSFWDKLLMASPWLLTRGLQTKLIRKKTVNSLNCQDFCAISVKFQDGEDCTQRLHVRVTSREWGQLRDFVNFDQEISSCRENWINFD